MSASDGPAVPPLPEPSTEAPIVPLEALDRALAPVRRGVRFAVGGGGVGAHLAVILRRQMALALALPLPAELAHELAAIDAHLVQWADSPDEVGPPAEVYARLTRLDAVAGLPLRQPLRAVRKPVQRDRSEKAGRERGDRSQKGARSERGDRSKPADRSDTSARAAKPRRPPQEGAEMHGAQSDGWDGSLDAPLDEGIGGELAEALAASDMGDMRSLLLRRPTDQTTLSPVHGATSELPSGPVAVGGKVSRLVTVLRATGTLQTRFLLQGAEPVEVQLRGGSMPTRLHTGDRVVVAGVHGESGISEAEVVAAHDGTVVLSAYGIPAVSDAAIRGAIRRSEAGAARVRDPVSSDVLRTLGLPALGHALVGAHHGRHDAVKRLAFDEALAAHLAVTYPRYNGTQERGIAHTVHHSVAGKIAQTLELVLNDPQQQVFEDIKRDLRLSQPMRRLLTGEVGAGKGRVAAMAAAMVAEGRSQVLVVTSDETEAELRLMHSEPIFREAGLVARCVAGEPRSAIRDALKRGEIHVVFGTQDLLQQQLEFRRLGLVIAIERDRFGRASALHRSLTAPRPDLLVLTGVPVGPRILMTAYSDLDLSVLDHGHRLPASIRVCGADARSDAYESVRQGVARREQAIVVFPLVRGADALDMRDARRMVQALEADALSGLRVGLFHGAMAVADRQRAYDDLVYRRIDVLVATTTIEDGPPPPGVSRVVVEQADRVEQWRLHRIVGFLSTAAVQGEALLVVGEQAEPDAEARVQRVLSARNGFELTGALVKHQGLAATVEPGSSPMPQFQWLDVDRDFATIVAARTEAHRVLGADPGLRRGAHVQLAHEARARFQVLWPESEDEKSRWSCAIPEAPPSDRRRRRRRRRRR